MASGYDLEATFEDGALKKFFSSLQKNLMKVRNGERKFAGVLSSVIFADVMDHFKKEEGPKGTWQEWSPTYAEYMESIGKGKNKKLQFSGKLRNNFKPTNYKHTRDGMTWFNDAKTKGGFPYAAAHDEGGPILPQREFMYLSDKGLETLSANVLAFILDEGI